MRCGEALSLEWIDVDIERRTVRVTPEKGSNPRIFKVSSKLIAMLEALPKRNEKIFGILFSGVTATFWVSRKRAAQKLKNSRLLEIHFHTFRHWKATMLYYETKDVLFVMNFLGHKNIKNTMLYIQLEQALLKEISDDFTCKVAKTAEEAEPLIEAGFEYVCTTPEGLMLFRKRK